MAESRIEWTDYTFNPWEGCEKVSPGCKHCYAEKRDQWLHRGAHWGPNSQRFAHTDAYWAKPLLWDRQAAAAGRIARVFCGSLCDALEAGEYLDTLRARAFDMVAQTPNLMWLFLTKRPENWKLFPESWRSWQWPSNAMFGFTGENAEWFKVRLPFWHEARRAMPGLRTFISAEPLLSDLDFACSLTFQSRLVDWVICGGESGDHARPMHPDWPRKLRDDCAAAGVPFFFKQWGKWSPIGKAAEHEHIHVAGGLDGCHHRMFNVGKTAAGRLLDGREHNALPAYWPANVGLPPRPAKPAKAELVVLA